MNITVFTNSIREKQTALSFLYHSLPMVLSPTTGSCIHTKQCIFNNKSLVQQIIDQGLAGFWLASDTLHSSFDTASVKLFQVQRQTDTALYLAQLGLIQDLHSLFTANNIQYAVFKGAHSREVLYGNPSIRPSADVDILILPDQRYNAFKLLLENDYLPKIHRETISHELSMEKHFASIDFHWDILRPGRIHTNLAKDFLNRRVVTNNFYTLCPDDELFVLLIHSVFSKYLTAPHSRLCVFVDILYWALSRLINWERVLRQLSHTRFFTAAWLTCTYIKLLTETTLFDDLLDLCAPSRYMQKYFGVWLTRDFSTKFLHIPFIPQCFLTLPAHDRFSDIIRTIAHILTARISSDKEFREIESRLNLMSGP